MNKKKVLEEYHWIIKCDPPGRDWDLSNDGSEPLDKRIYRRWPMDSLDEALDTLEIMWTEAGMSPEEIRACRMKLRKKVKHTKEIFLCTWVK